MAIKFLEEKLALHRKSIYIIFEHITYQLEYGFLAENENSFDVFTLRKKLGVAEINQSLELIIQLVNVKGYSTEGVFLKKQSGLMWKNFIKILEKKLSPAEEKETSKISIGLSAEGLLQKGDLNVQFKQGTTRLNMINELRDGKYHQTSELISVFEIKEEQVRSHIKDINKRLKKELELSGDNKAHVIVHRDGYGYHINPIYRLYSIKG